MLIRDVRPWGGGERSDVILTGDRIAAIRPHDPAAQPSGEVVEARGRLLLPSFSDVHVHVDSTRIGLPFRPHTGGPGVWAMTMNDRENWRSAEVPLVERVAGTLEWWPSSTGRRPAPKTRTSGRSGPGHPAGSSAGGATPNDLRRSARMGVMAGDDTFEPESERVTRTLRDQILDGVRAPGSKLVERELAAELGVSRLPVRDALKDLVNEGLVTPRPRSWAVVREFTASDVEDLDEVKAALETLAFRLAAQRRTRAGLARLRADLDAELRAAAKGDAVPARRAAADFHETVTALADNELLNELGRTLSSRMRWLLGQHDDISGVAKEHEELYEAIEARDVPRVEALALKHLATGRSEAAAHRERTPER
ncbi:FCD domain-containing protein [Streptomyces sp. NBC_01197]|uniref:FCD domain-containing protein n=1 Tax=Streptomyces sp. NBC_01197 TaxID=2903768 RepID=UPI002E139F9B|nr:FCD domain-containing protein [Streptomyces sp. NBC_01197]